MTDNRVFGALFITYTSAMIGVLAYSMWAKCPCALLAFIIMWIPWFDIVSHTARVLNAAKYIATTIPTYRATMNPELAEAVRANA